MTGRGSHGAGTARTSALAAAVCAAVAAFAALAPTAGAQTPRETPVVRVESGKLVGEDLGAVRAYRGIPYAAPPVGERRWAAPQPPEDWKGVRKALAFGKIFPQVDRRAGPENQSEDALLLNIWAPAKAKDAPVLVWFHGGGFIQNSAADPRSDGRALAERGVVVVSINYRLGALGLFAHPELTAAAKPGEPLGNYLLLDMIQSLRWVRKNIAAFGGDARNITISGSSAGATAILYLLGVREADAFYDKVIIQHSGGFDNVLTLAEAEAAGVRLAEDLKVDPPGLAGLRALPGSAFALGPERTRRLELPVKPFVDGRLVTASVAEVFAAGRQRKVPLLIGSANGESGARGYGDDIAVGGGFAFQLQLADAMVRAGQAPWVFHFTFVPPERPRTAQHGEVVGYLFGTVRSEAGTPARAMTEAVMDYWTTFMRTGRPDVAGRPAWTPFDSERRSVMVFGNEAIAVKPAPPTPAASARPSRRAPGGQEPWQRLRERTQTQ